MCVLCRREAILQSAFPIAFPEINNQHPGFRQMAHPLPTVCVWCRRDVIFLKKRAFGVDETTLDFQNVHLVSTRRSLESAVCRKGMFYVGERPGVGFSVSEIF